MDAQQLKELEDELWLVAETFRVDSQLKVSEYYLPVLGLIMLRYAQNIFEETKIKIENQIAANSRSHGRSITLTKDDFTGQGSIFLNEESKYDYLANLPESQDIGSSINHAMQLIENDYPDMEGILPKNYQELEGDLLRGLIRTLNSEKIRSLPGDVFGRIYEFFLMKFAQSGAGGNDDGEFFTPPSLVNLIINFIEPNHGVIHDPACGSGGMFVQTGYFLRNNSDESINEKISIKGTEKIDSNAKLAKMNLRIHGIENTIISGRDGNSYYSDPHDLVGKCDFVLANPPFNVKKVDKKRDFVVNDPRLLFGLPNADNANYLWIQYFHSYLNEKGRAGFVMASSATDAGNTEKLIRQKFL